MEYLLLLAIGIGIFLLISPYKTSKWIGLSILIGLIIGAILGGIGGSKIGISEIYFGARDGAIIWCLINCCGGTAIALWGQLILNVFSVELPNKLISIIFWLLITMSIILAAYFFKIQPSWINIWKFSGILGSIGIGGELLDVMEE